MMLPSGNDAAYLIAEVGGAMARMLKEGKEGVDDLEDVEGVERLLMRGNNVSLFLREMNRIAWEVGMGSSNFANPHGLANPANYSTALDLCKLCTHAMKNPIFRTIVSTQTHHYHAQLPHPDADK
jgi:D-alanyl-D-alanine carboxypeptidase